MHVYKCANNNIFSWYVYEISLTMFNQKVTCWKLLLIDKQITHLHTFFTNTVLNGWDIYAVKKDKL